MVIEDWHRELRRKSMKAEKKLTIEECKRIQLEILNYIDSICHQNNLRYFLCGGTLLGAIRHKGFIPWDDDIDIMLPRPDYRKLIDLLKDDNRYKSLSAYYQKDYIYPFAKVVDLSTSLYENQVKYDIKDYGVYVDLFPLDGMPKGDKAIQRHYKKVARLRFMRTMSLNVTSGKGSNIVKHLGEKILWLYARMLGWKYWNKKIEKVCLKYNYSISDKIGFLTASYGSARIILDKAVYENKKRVPFEEYCFDIPAGYDEYLTSSYGNYMEYPPIEKRVSGHNYVAYRK